MEAVVGGSNWPTNVSRRFGTYVLPGRITDPRRGIAEAVEAERIGLGTAWLSERFALKDAPTLCGAMAQATSRIGVGGTTYFLNRHPLTLASFMSTMQAISGDRFSLIFARAFKSIMERWGMPWSSFALMTDMAQILRRLLAGESVRYSGPAGDYPDLRLIDRYQGPPPRMILTAMGPKMLELAGAHFDGVLLHPMLTTDTVSRMAGIAREGARKAGRDPAAFRVYANVIAAPDLEAADEEAIVGGRAVTYLHGYGELLVDANGWSRAPLQRLREQPVFARLGGEMADLAFTRQQLVEASRVLPDQWFSSSCAIGSSTRCAQRLKEYIDAGADEIVLHGSAPSQMPGMIEALGRLYPG
jgi:probable F420-dependent oxidoreductase